MTLQHSGRPKFPAFAVYHLFWQAVDLLYPPTCPSCGKQGARWCDECQQAVVRVGPEVCPICGAVWVGGSPCPDCQKHSPPYLALRSWGLYQGTLRKAIHHLKYKKDIGLGEVLAHPLLDLLAAQGWQVDAVTAVPLSHLRFRERGYNQAGMIARPLAMRIEKPYLPKVLRKTRETRSQVGLNASERRQNIHGAFQADAGLTAGKVILVVDDVTTTGATIEASARALLDAGAAAVYGITLARAGRRPDGDWNDAPV